jgi:hypothetical protein
MSELILYQQGTDVAPAPDGFDQATNPLVPSSHSVSRLIHFTDGVYDTSSESHLMRLLKVLLGDVGVSQLHKRNLLARLQQTMGGIHFFDLDSFYGAVFGARRRKVEILGADPATDSLTPEEWDQGRIRDGAYRSRIEQFAKALNLGATVDGIEAVAEALLGVQVDVIESWKRDEKTTRSWGDVERLGTAGINYLQLPGTAGNFASVPSATVSLTGDIEIVARVSATDWTPAAALRIFSKINGASIATGGGYELYVNTSGGLEFQYSNGTSSFTHAGTSALPLTDGSTYWVRAVFTASSSVQFFWAQDQNGEPITWNSAGSAVVTSAPSANAILGNIGTINGLAGRDWNGNVYRVIVRSSGGTIALDADFTRGINSASTTTFTEFSSNAATVTINRSGSPQAETIYSIVTYGTLEGYSYSGLETGGSSAPLVNERHTIRVYPHRTLTQEERYSTQLALDRIKPAGTLVYLESGPTRQFIEVPIASVHADSEHWETRSQIRNSPVNKQYLSSAAPDSLFTPPTPAWGAYQGEAWSLMVNSPSAVAYTSVGQISLSDQVDPDAKDLPAERVVPEVGREVNFLPTFSIKPVQAILAGRAVSDGVLVSNPMTGWIRSRLDRLDVSPIREFQLVNTTINPTSVAQVYVDGIPLSVLASLPSGDSAGRVLQLFWSTPSRPANSTQQDVLEIRFDTEGEFNTLSFEIAAFPQQVDIQVWRPATGQWETINTQNYYRSNPAGITGRIPTGWLHPYHYGYGHWVPIRVTLEAPVTARYVRFVFKRFSSETAASFPIGTNGKPIAYPLGLRNVDVGYRLNSQSLIPNVDLSQPIVTTKNILGQTVQHSIYKYQAGLATDSSETFWKCEAQPISNAVVNFYADVSDASSQPQSFDRLFIDPYCSGPTMNLYWSATDPTDADLAETTSKEQPLLPLRAIGSLIAEETGDGGITWPDGAREAYFDFDNNEIGFDPRKAWWAMAEFYPNFPTNSIPDGACLFSMGTEVDPVNFGDVALSFSSSLGLVLRVFGKTISCNTWTWTPGQKICVSCSYAPETGVIQLVVTNPSGAQVTGGSMSGVITSTTNTPGTIRIGRSVTTSGAAISADIRLIKFALGYGNPDLASATATPESRTNLVLNPKYPAMSVSNTESTKGTVIRFHPDYRNRYSPLGYSYGWMGGRPDHWDQIRWTPVTQDYVLAKGYLRFPTIRAKYLKMEFTNLAPEPFEAFLVHNKGVKTHPTTGTAKPLPLGRTNPMAILPAQMQFAGTSTRENSTVKLPFERYITFDTGDPYLLRPSPTSGLVAKNAVVAQSIASQGGFGYTFITWQPDRFSPQFTTAGKHAYDEMVISHRSKVGFFVGLRSIQISRSDPTVMIDTPAYVDPFFDMTGIESFTSSYDPGIFRTPSASSSGVLGTAQVVTSKSFLSISNVMGVQFATQQTPPQQIVPDDQFKDPSLETSTFSDSTKWHSQGDAVVVWDSERQGVRVTRDPSTLTYQIEKDTPLVHRPITPVFTTRNVVTTTVVSGTSGGIETPGLIPSAKGVLHIGVRLTPIGALDASLYIQLMGSDGTTVLQEQAVWPQADVQVEATMSYILNSNPTLEGSLRVRVVQRGAYRNQWMMNAISVFDDGLLWEFSNDGGSSWVPAYDVRNNYTGLVTFRSPSNSLKWRCTMYRQNVGIDLIDMRPWYQYKLGGL